MKNRLYNFLGYTLGAALLVRRSRLKIDKTDELLETSPGKSKHATEEVWNTQARPAAPAAGAKPGLMTVIKQTVNSFMEDDCMTLGAAIAYYSVFSLAPLLLMVISIAGLVFGRAAVGHQIQAQIQGLIGPGAAKQIDTMVQSAGQNQSTGIIGTVIGIVVLIFGATGAFTALQDALNKTWHVKPDPKVSGLRSFLTKRVLSFAMILGVVFLLIVSLAMSAALAAVGGWISSFLPMGFSGGLLQVLGAIASFIVIALLFGLIFRVLPDGEIVWRDVWIGGAVTSLLFTLGKTGLGIYLGRSSTASPYGAAGSLVLIVLWLYYASLILLLGAEFTRQWAAAHGRPIQPEEGAVRVITHEQHQRSAQQNPGGPAADGGEAASRR